MGKAAMARCTRRRKKGWSKEEKNRNKSWVQHEDIQKRKEDILCLSHRWGWPVSLLLKLEWKGNSRAVGGDPAIPSLSSFTPQELSAKCWPLASLEFTWVCLTALWSSYAVTGIAFHWEWTGVWKNGKRRKRLKKKNQSRYPGAPPCHLLTCKWPVQRKIYSSPENGQTPNFSGNTSWERVPSITSWVWLRYVISVWKRFSETSRKLELPR